MNPADLDGLYAELERTGRWYGLFPDNDPGGRGRVAVQRGADHDDRYTEVYRTTDGRGWVIAATRQCGRCGGEVRIIQPLAGTEVDLAAEVNRIAALLTGTSYRRWQHHHGCPNLA